MIDKLDKGLEKKLNLKEKIQKHYEYLIREDICNKELVSQCCVSGLVKNCDGDYMEFQFKEPYEKVSHGYSPAVYDKIMEEVRQIPKIRRY